ncbi:MAG: dihydropteroate synthase [Candidatus Omnitrophota bacterium]
MLIIGELINGMFKNVREAILNKDKQTIIDLAIKQIEAGANALDVNVGPLSKEPVTDMEWLVNTIQEKVNTRLCLDSTKPELIEAGLKLAKNKAIINSTTADVEKLNIVVPLALRYNASLIGLALNKKGVPQDKDRRLELAAEIVGFCEAENFPIKELYLDPIVLPINVAQAQSNIIFDSIKEFKLLSDPSPNTIIGLSNSSQGAKNRRIINKTYAIMSMLSGLDAAILDPLDKDLIDLIITSEIILNKQIYCDSFLEAYRKKAG